MAERIWSPAQQAVFAAVEDDTKRHLVIEALAGSGKTTTIVEALSHTREGESCLFVAFNKSIADELKHRVPDDVEVSTLHSFGLKAVNAAFSSRKVSQWRVQDQLKPMLPYGDGAREARTAVARLVSIAKGCLISSFDDLDAAADEYGIDFPKAWSRERLIGCAQRVMREALGDSTGPIDYDDMIWLPIARSLNIRTFRWVFVDETQDLNPCQLELVVRAAGDTGRIVAVGDRRQAIYGFRGADRQAIPRMIARLNADVLPLNVTYRCPTSVVAEAQQLVPALEYAPNAAAGIVREASEDSLFNSAQPGDFVISRTNAPLISLCYRWLKAGRRAAIKGRDIGAGLASWIKSTNAATIIQLQSCITAWHRGETERLVKQDRPTTSVDDRADCLEALLEGCGSVQQVLAKIEALFNDLDERAAILLTSTHRAKGLEADRVWLLRDTYLKWPGAEEENLLYVAITRSKRELIYVRRDAAIAAGEAAE